MCHDFLNDSRFYQFLLHIDQETAAEVQADGCSCGGVLHSARCALIFSFIVHLLVLTGDFEQPLLMLAKQLH